MKKPIQAPSELNDADLDAASAGFAGASGTGKTLTSTLLSKHSARDVSDGAVSLEPTKGIVGSGGGSDI
jgi:GH24 family phage-related lysozyme (muramidase)